MKKLHASVSAKIFFIFTAFLLVIFLVVGLINNAFTYRNMVEQARISDLRLLDTLSCAIDGEINQLCLSGAVFQSDEALLEYMDTITQRASEDKSVYLKEDSRNVTGSLIPESTSQYASLVDADGYLVGEQALERQSVYNFLGHTAMKNFSRDEPTLCKMFRILDLATGERHNVFPMMFPLHRNERFLGYVVLYLDETRLSSLFEAYGDSIAILDSDNVILAATDSSTLYNTYHTYYKINYAYLLRDTTTTTKIDGMDYIITTRTINDMGWQAVITKSVASVLEESGYSLRYYIFSIAISFVISGIVVLLIAFFIGRPIARLNESVEEVKRGALSVRSDIRSHDEIGQLSISINEMLDTITTLLKQTEENERAKRRAQMQLVQAQLKPHFLYNILGIISGFMNDGEKRLGSLAIDSLAQFYRISLSNGNDVIPLRQEIELIEKYLTLQQLRYVDLIDYEIDVDDDALEVMVPKFTLQPLVENAIYHGIREKEGGGFIQVRGYMQDNLCILTVRDNGLGMSADTLAEVREAIHSQTLNTHFGLSSIFRRLDFCYHGHAQMDVESELGHSTSITIHIQVDAFQGGD